MERLLRPQSCLCVVLRNHRQKRFDNRRQSKIAPSILAGKQLELRVIKELLAIFSITHFYVEILNKSDSPAFTRAAQGQNWLALKLKPLLIVELVRGYETFNTRHQLGLADIKTKPSNRRRLSLMMELV